MRTKRFGVAVADAARPGSVRSRARSTLGTEQNSNYVNNLLRTACLLYIWGIQSQAYENSGSDPSALQDPRPGYFRTCKSVAPTEGKQNTV